MPSLAKHLESIPTRETRKTRMDNQHRDEQKPRGQRYEILRAWWVREMLSTPSPLPERMTLFSHNHFTSGQDKVQCPQQMAQQNMLLRHDALGNFGELLHAVAKDPAMLQYLDGARDRKGKPNENFVREVMELFTLGEGHYAQRDLSEAARDYTGWGLDPDTQAYVWRANQHDDGDRTVLDQTDRSTAIRWSTSCLHDRKLRSSSRPGCGASSSPKRRTPLASHRSPRSFTRVTTISRWRCAASL